MTLAFATAMVPPLTHLTPRKPKAMSTDVPALVQMAAMCVLCSAIEICFMAFVESQSWWSGGNGTSHQVTASGLLLCSAFQTCLSLLNHALCLPAHQSACQACPVGNPKALYQASRMIGLECEGQRRHQTMSFIPVKLRAVKHHTGRTGKMMFCQDLCHAY